MITIIDYGSGNIASIGNMLKKVGHRDYTIVSDPSSVDAPSKIILPGVGHFDHGMSKLNDSGWTPILRQWVEGKRIPVLGICLGFQLMTQGSEEGSIPGLGWFDAETLNFDGRVSEEYKVPHMAWSEVDVKKEQPLFVNMDAHPRFYFVHTYYVHANREEDVLVNARYDFEFTAGMQRGNIYGVQFHPEKSHRYGMAVLKNFAEL